ncbi:MAG: PA14 domain-containing protein, partial [Planctomycetota bacterium]
LAHFDHAQKAWPLDPVLAVNRINVLGNAGRVREALESADTLLAGADPGSSVSSKLRSARKSWRLASSWGAAQKLSRSLASAALRGRNRVKGFQGVYYGGRQFEKEIRRRSDRELGFSWRWESPAPGVPRDNFSVRWSGYFELPEADELSFVGVCSDGIRVRIDGRLVIDAWRVSNDTIEEASLELAPGLHDIEIEYFESRGDAGLVLLVTAESRPDVIPHDTFFFHPGP